MILTQAHRSTPSSIRGLALALLGGLILDAGGARARGFESKVEERTLESGSLQRRYLVHVPPQAAKGHRMPLVFLLHGGGGHADKIAKNGEGGRMEQLSDQEGFLLVYPDGIAKGWNDGRSDLHIPVARKGVDDVQFFQDMIRDIQREFSIDPARIHSCGISNGGFMSLALAAAMPETLASIAAVTANVSVDLARNVHPSEPISVIFLNGTKDPLVPFDGGEVQVLNQKRGKILSTAQSVLWWAQVDGCRQSIPLTWLANRAPLDGTRIARSGHTGGRNGTEVVLYTVVGGGHTWPGGVQYLPRFLVGPTSQDAHGSDLIWEFFQSHPRRKQADGNRAGHVEKRGKVP